MRHPYLWSILKYPPQIKEKQLSKTSSQVYISASSNASPWLLSFAAANYTTPPFFLFLLCFLSFSLFLYFFFSFSSCVTTALVFLFVIPCIAGYDRTRCYIRSYRFSWYHYFLSVLCVCLSVKRDANNGGACRGETQTGIPFHTRQTKPTAHAWLGLTLIVVVLSQPARDTLMALAFDGRYHDYDRFGCRHTLLSTVSPPRYFFYFFLPPFVFHLLFFSLSFFFTFQFRFFFIHFL